MGLTTIIRAFGIALVILGLAMVLPIVVALAIHDPAVADYFFAACITFFFGAGCIAASAGRPAPTDIRGALLIVLLWWVVAPVFGALPFVVGGEPFIEAYFESVSALTTTGAWLLEGEARSSAPGMLWRAIMQWIGGLGSLAIAAAIFVRPVFVGIDTLLPPFSRGERDSYLHAIKNAVISFFSVYLLITTTCFAALLLANSPVLDAGVTAMSVVASGGFVPGFHGQEVYSPHAPGVLLPFLFLSGANFILIVRLLRMRRQNLRDIETGAYATIIVCVAFLLWLLSGAGDIDRLPAQFFNAVSLMSTNGYIIGERPSLTVALVAVIIGGSAVSTAGGLKVLRWIVIMRRTG
ncbi:MAG: TrkH family potassium uptake protein, partial [Parvularculaceae bacterium]|nr:TrkH family potassium uptake protein [Parvularculaceae bacterium]